MLRFEVTDTGVGIPADRLERIFGSFTQVDASITRQYGGTGLGLAIVKQLLDLMGGEIGVESIENEGATFWFTVGFPSERSRSNSSRSERVLVVHDDPETLLRPRRTAGLPGLQGRRGRTGQGLAETEGRRR